MAKRSEQGSTRGAGRTRTWTFILYPESAPDNWRETLNDLFIEWVESPLHDKDVNPDGEIKKPHWHILLIFPSVKTYEQVSKITDMLKAPSPQKAMSAKGVVRYMVHLDNPEKFQYDKADIKGYGGVDVNDLLRPTSSDRYNLIKEMIIFIRENDIKEMKDLLDYAIEERFDDWFPLLSDNSAYIVGQYIKSNRHGTERGNQNERGKKSK